MPLTPALEWASALLALMGLVIAIWARLALGRNWSGMVALKDEHELVTSGPYAVIRHPIYTALICLCSRRRLRTGTLLHRRAAAHDPELLDQAAR